MTLTPVDAEFLLINLDAAVRVRHRGQFFLWVQGQLQALVPHQWLICVARGEREDGYRHHVDVFSRDPLPQEQKEELSADEHGMLHAIINEWQEGGGTVWFGESDEFRARWRLSRWLGGMHLAAHGVFDASGTPGTMFVVAGVAAYEPGRHGRFLELIGPHLADAFVRAVLSSGGRESLRPQSSIPILTGRQLEVLRYVQQGKSNNEIGVLLEISPLTVKNHVQTLLRKLKAQNRAQAVSFGIEQRIIQPGMEGHRSMLAIRDENVEGRNGG